VSASCGAAPSLNAFHTRLCNKLPLYTNNQLGPFTVAFFAVIVALINQFSQKIGDPANASPAISSIELLWHRCLLRAAGQHRRCRLPIEAEERTGAEHRHDSRRNQRHQDDPIIDCGWIYAGVATVDELLRTFNEQRYSHSHADADRVAQVGWILYTFYLLHHLFECGLRSS